MMPALFTRTSSRPACRRTPATMSRTWSSRDTSARTTHARRPRRSISRATSAAGPALARKLTATSAPSRASPRAMARPKPRPAPVTRATRPSRRPILGAVPGSGRGPGGRGRGGRVAGGRGRGGGWPGQPEARQLDGLRPPHVALAQDALDEALDHAHARRPPDDLRVAEPVAEAALLVEALELLRPDLPHVLLAPDAIAHRRHRAPQEERRVVVAPRGGELDEAAVGRLVAVGQVGVERVAVVDEAVLGVEVHAVGARVGRGHAGAERP